MWADPQGAYAILGLLLLGIIGAAIAPGGLRDRPRRTRPLSELQLAGSWADGGDTLELHADGAYLCRGTRCTGFGSKGTWTREADGSLTARWSDGHQVPWRVVTYHGRYRLGLVPARDAGASWEGHLSFEKVMP